MTAVHKLSFNVNIDELREYYDILCNNYKQYLWTSDLFNYGTKKSQEYSNTATVRPSGWALIKYLDNIDILPPWNIIHNDGNCNIKTEMIFGIAERIWKTIPGIKRLSISVSPEGVTMDRHSDDDVVIHIPIYSPVGSVFNFYPNNNKETYNLLADGSAYLCNTYIDHDVCNNGPGDRVHLFFFVDANAVDTIKNLIGTI